MTIHQMHSAESRAGGDTIVAARFATQRQAEAVQSGLLAHGFEAHDVDVFYFGPAGRHDLYPLGGDQAIDPNAEGAGGAAVGGVAVGAAAGAALGAVASLAGGAGMGTALPLVAGGAAAGAYGGSLAGALMGTRSTADRPSERGDEAHPIHVGDRQESGSRQPRASGMMVTAHAMSPDRAMIFARIAGACGGEDLEQAQGNWSDGHWQDFDPLSSPRPLMFQ